MNIRKIMMKGQMCGLMTLKENGGVVDAIRRRAVSTDTAYIFMRDGSVKKCPAKANINEVIAVAVCENGRLISSGSFARDFDWRVGTEKLFGKPAQKPEQKKPEQKTVEQKKPEQRKAECKNPEEKPKKQAPKMGKCSEHMSTRLVDKRALLYREIEWRRVDVAYGGHYLIGTDKDGKKYVAVSGSYGASPPGWLGDGGEFIDGYWIYSGD